MTFPSQHPWLHTILAWLDKHPEREFYLTQIPINAVTPAGLAGWIVGVASQPIKPNGTVGADVAVGATHIPCIVRRPDAVSGRPLPGVLLIDGVGAMPPLPKSMHFPAAEQAYKEEKLAEGIWTMAQAAAAANLSLNSVIHMAGAARSQRSR